MRTFATGPLANMARVRRFFGWSVVWVACAVAAFGFGVGFYGPTVWLATLHTTKGWPIGAIATAATAHFLVGALVVAYLPEVHRAIGTANATILGALLSAIGILGWSSVTAPWQLLFVVVISGSGWGATSGAAINAMIAPWFDRDRATALSYALNGASLGGVIFTPLLVWLIAHVGLHCAALIVGLGMVVVVGTLAHRYLRYRPADFGLAADGSSMVQSIAPGDIARLSRATLMKTRAFATMAAAFALALFAQVGVLSHLLSRLSPELGASGAAAAISGTTMSAVAGRMLLANLLCQHDRRLAAALNSLVQSIGVGLLCSGNAVPVLLAGCVLFGLGFGNSITLSALIAQQEFSSADVETVVSLVVAVNQAIFALSPAILSGLRQVSADYALVFASAGVAQIMATIIILLGRRRALPSSAVRQPGLTPQRGRRSPAGQQQKSSLARDCTG